MKLVVISSLSLLLVILFSCATSTSAAEKIAENADEEVKVSAADGRRHRSRNHRRPWSSSSYYQPPVIDRNVCDLDASVLVVVEGGHHGRSKARRVKCSEVAFPDDDSCTICCQNTARIDGSIKNLPFEEEMFGFLTVVDQLSNYRTYSGSGSHGDDYARRPKRSAAARNASDSESEELEDFAPAQMYRNLKCLCCAPRRYIPPPPHPGPYHQPFMPFYSGYGNYQTTPPTNPYQPGPVAPTYPVYPVGPTPYPAVSTYGGQPQPSSSY